MTIPAIRRLWQLAEPIHAVTYFAPEAREAFEGAGLRGFWRGYFAGRAAPLGAVGPGVVTACFFGFHPDFVRRALPSVWSLAPPARALEARLAGADGALRRMLDGAADADTTVTDAADIVRRGMDEASVAGRPLFAANRELEWPTDPHLALWHGTTLLREHRGDGHVAALGAAGFDPCEGHVTQVAARGAPPESIQPYRGWSDDDWGAAAERLRSRGWLTDDGTLSPEGRSVRDDVEDTTDRLAGDPWARAGDTDLEQLIELLQPIAARVLAAGEFPDPNPIGVPPPETGA
ncbi:MAG: SCO6745 family protein [Acidimicrobiales bacterium]